MIPGELSLQKVNKGDKRSINSTLNVKFFIERGHYCGLPGVLPNAKSPL